MKVFSFLLLIICMTSFAESFALNNISNSPLNTNPKSSKEIHTASREADRILDKKAETKKIASNAKREFRYKIFKVWNPPVGSVGQKATARIILNENGTISSMMINSSDSEMKASIELAIRNATPFPMPPNPDARDEAQRFTIVFTVK